MQTTIKLPQWLDELLFEKFGAEYKRERQNLAVVDWDREHLKSYLGTYFPRSYAEAETIFKKYFKTTGEPWGKKSELSILNLGCGTGGDTIGMLNVLSECLPRVNRVRLRYFDGNQESLNIFEEVLCNYRKWMKGIEITERPIPYTVEDLSDFRLLQDIASNRMLYDIVISFKMVCEFISKSRFDDLNTYKEFVEAFLPALAPGGIMVLGDIASRDAEQSAWYPDLMDNGIQKAGGTVYMRNLGNYDIFHVAHSKVKDDSSKLAWRIIQK
jgi:hypothetical protein